MNWNLKMEDVSKSKKVRIALGILLAIIFTLAVLRVGMMIGYRQARFSGQFGNNFERNFLGPRGGRGMMSQAAYPTGYGALGKVLSVTDSKLILLGPDNLEKTVLVSTSTLVHRYREQVKIEDVKVDDFVVVIGAPDQSGQVNAKLIRIMPAPNQNVMSNVRKQNEISQ